ncbi:peptidylprolyl isomerase [Sphingorhabdus lutea]|uniref:Peptidyl-prolyl cis-trans isomerase n=1 Tax=Sphingorhabdus lutea TaxID=1913578 RepID=A0A1L3JE33_9SPHN|nr:FKBP-type peptidyl-prolyl cis-trans isomerase [Sphingorhabdus lutea]APG63369.1 peptidylprolyl isomerase [Sphingorhabdus lutea]
MSVTAVPIQPIKKSSLVKLWAGLAILLLAAIALAFFGTKDVRAQYSSNEAFLADNAGNSGVTTTPSGLQIETIRKGEGPSPTDEDVALVKYKGMLRDGTVFDENEQAPMPVAGVVPGFSEALKLMQRGGQYRIWIPSALGYGDQDVPPQGEVKIPGGSVLIFEVDLLEYKSRAELEAAQKQFEEMQKAQGGAAPTGVPQAGPAPQ